MESEERLRILSRQVITSQDEERARLSRELHDGLGQQLAAILFQLISIKDRPGAPPDKMIQIEKMLKNAGEDLHRICKGLKPMTLKQFGLEPALKMLIWDLMDNYKIPVVFSLESRRYNLDGEKAIAVYRVCQEALMNSIRHSGSDKIEVDLRRENNLLILEVKDKGKGFDINDSSVKGRLGIETMNQRADLCGGRFSISSEARKGTTVRLEIPINPDSGEQI